ncbi:F-box domain and ankyrin repeat protein [Cordyceps javanica]|nr:F-box domain and ankyrin repeat protein [Cordyceps javanica]
MIQLLIRQGANANAGNRRGSTPMHVAAMHWSNEHVIKVLKDLGVSINRADRMGTTALHEAARSSGARMVNQLISSGANPFGTDNTGATPLHVAAWYGNLEAASALLCRTRNSGIDISDNQARTALFYACWQGHTTLCSLLVERGANVRCQDTTGATILHAALINQSRGCFVEVFRDPTVPAKS